MRQRPRPRIPSDQAEPRDFSFHLLEGTPTVRPKVGHARQFSCSLLFPKKRTLMHLSDSIQFACGCSHEVRNNCRLTPNGTPEKFIVKIAEARMIIRGPTGTSGPLPGQERDDLIASLQKFGAIPPLAVDRAGEEHLFPIFGVPVIFGKTNLPESRFLRKQREGRTRFSKASFTGSFQILQELLPGQDLEITPDSIPRMTRE